MKEIPLTRGKIALVDDQDFEKVMQRKWHFHLSGAATDTPYPKKGKIFMHHLILGRKSMLEVDHINGNRLDNRRENLRFATHQQNLFNRSKIKNSVSGFKGVSRKRNKWRATMTLNGKSIWLGVFSEKEDAHAAFCEAAKKHHGEFFHA